MVFVLFIGLRGKKQLQKNDWGENVKITETWEFMNVNTMHMAVAYCIGCGMVLGRPIAEAFTLDFYHVFFFF